MSAPKFDPKTNTVSQKINDCLLTVHLGEWKVVHVLKDANTLILNQIVFRVDFYEDSRVYHGWVLAPYVNPELVHKVDDGLIPHDVFDAITGELI